MIDNLSQGEFLIALIKCWHGYKIANSERHEKDATLFERYSQIPEESRVGSRDLPQFAHVATDEYSSRIEVRDDLSYGSAAQRTWRERMEEYY